MSSPLAASFGMSTITADSRGKKMPRIRPSCAVISHAIATNANG